MSRDIELVVEALPAYEIGEEIGRGASGHVIAGHHRRLGRDVAIKQLPRALGGDPEVRARFLAEARLLASLDHPHIVPIYDYVEHEGLCLLVMERLNGGTVWGRARVDGMSAQDACAVALGTCAGLHYAHGKGVLHRDVKPENLMFSGDGVLKVTDFGIAKVIGGLATLATKTGFVLGTPAYIAPEQAQGGELTPATDVYAAGIVLYELLAGERPFPPVSDPVAALYQRVHEDPRPLHEVAPLAPEPLAAAVDCALARDPDRRYPTAQAFGAALADAARSAWGAGWLASSAIKPRGVDVDGGAEGRPRSLPARTVAGSGTRAPRSRADAATATGHGRGRSDAVGVARTRLRTVVVTDVVGSTELVAQLGGRDSERMLLSHIEDLRREVDRAFGTVVKTLGDRIMALFDAAEDATACAVAMQRAVSRKPVHGRAMSIRIGVSSGDVRLQEGDCHGVAVVEACRLCEAAAVGQILVAESARLLARGAPASYRRIDDLALKGLPEPVGTSELDWAAEPEPKLRVLVADDAVLLRQGIAHVLEERGFDVVAQAGDGEECVRLALELRPDVVVVDVHMPPTYTAEGLQAAERIRAEQPEIGLLVLSQDVDEHSARRLLNVGRAGLGYLLKERVRNVAEFADAVRSVAAGGTAFEAAVLAWLFGGDATTGGIRELSEGDLDVLRSSEHRAPGVGSTAVTELAE